MIDKDLQKIFEQSIIYARANKHEYITIDHIFLALIKDNIIKGILENLDIDLVLLEKNLKYYILQNTPVYPEKEINQDPIETISLTAMIEQTIANAQFNGKTNVSVEDIFVAILQDEKNYSSYLLKEQGLQRVDILEEISHGTTIQDELLEEFEELEEQLEEGIKQLKDKKSTLKEHSVELVSLANDGKIDPVIGRDTQIQRVIEILGRRKKNNPILLGETGVGKTAIVEGLALKIANKDVPNDLIESKIYMLDMGSMIAGTKYRGDFEKKLKSVLKDVKKDKKSILFIDEIHQIIGAGSVGNSSMDASNILKPLLSSGEIKVIGATTYDEYRNDFSKDKAFSRRFAKVDILEPSIEDTIQILNGLKEKYEQFHNVKYTPQSIQLCVELSKKFITDRFLPDSAIDILDEVAATKKYKRKSAKKAISITDTDVENTISKVAQIPPKTATKSDLTLLENLEKNLINRVFGQDEAIKTITKSIMINRAGLGETNQPIGSFLFTGATGVGKTEVAKELANVLGIHFERFDMSEYGESHTVSKLIGAPAGYVGHDKGGLLTQSIKKHPHCVLLLDEIEKAHPDLMSLLLQVMDNATLSDNNGVKIDFQNVILIMTSNLGAKQTNVMGFEKDTKLNENKAVKNFFAPEFRNRLDAVVSFNSLDEDVVIKIVTKFIKILSNQLKDKNITLTVSLKAKKELAKIGFDKLMGARPLQRVIRDKIKEPITSEILFGKLKDGGKIKIDFKKDNFDFKYIV